MIESDYYETAADWRLERYLENEDQLLRFEVVAAMISPGARSLLDLGTGNGAFLSFLESSSRRLNLSGLERSRAAIEASRCRADIVQGTIDALPFPDRAFDTVTALEVLEHLPHAVYAKALSEMARVASRQVLISVPYRERRLMVDCPECGCRFSPIFHLRTFDEGTLGGILPGFHLARSELVSVEVHWLLTDVANRLRAWRDRATGTVRVSSTCPQCGYALRPSEPNTASSAAVSGEARPSRLRAALLAKVPKVKRAYWIVASYERAGR